MKWTNRLLLIILCLIPVSVFLYLNFLELRFEEPRRGIVSLEMILSGDYIVPHINGAVYYNKPPFFNWMIIGMFRLFGSYENWVVRLPSILSLFLITGVNYLFVRRYLGRQVAVLSSLFFITAGDIYFFETLIPGEIDLFYGLIVYLQAVAIFHFYQTRRFLSLFLLSYLLTAIGVLTKGLPSFLFQGLTLLAIAIWQKDRRFLFRWQHLAGMVLMIVVAGSYFYAYSRSENLQPFLVNLFTEAKNKSGFGEKQNQLLANIFTFPLQLAKFLLPWSVLFLMLFQKRIGRLIKQEPLLFFCVLFFLVNVPPYWFTGSVKSRYMFMFYPFISILLAYVWIHTRGQLGKLSRCIEYFFLGFMILATLLFLAGPFIPATRDIPAILFKSLPFFAAGLFLCRLYYRKPEWRMLLFILFIVILRVGFAFYYFPLYEAKEGGQNRKDHIAAEMIRLADQQPIYLAGDTVSLQAKAGLGPVVLSEANIQTPPYIGYGIIYYYSKLSGRIMEYRNELGKDQYYIVYVNDFRDGMYRSRKAEKLYQCLLDKNKPAVALIRILD